MIELIATSGTTGLDAMSGSGGVRDMSGPMWMPSEPPTLGRILAPHLQPVSLVPALALLALVAYAWGVGTLSGRGVRWPWWRTLAFAVGIVVVWAVTATGVEGYGMMLFSVHMAQHMVLAMVAPILLLLGAPITLALRALPAQGAGSGVRRGLLRALASRWLRVLSSIPVRWFLFLSGLYGIYFTSLFDDLMSSVWGHNLMLLHFLGTGLLFFGPLVAADPWPGRGTPLLRLVEAFASTPFHAFFGIAIMTATSPIVDFFRDPPTGWGIDVVQDQGLAGGLAWATSEIPTMLLAGIIVIQWFRSDQREAKRSDRDELRTGDAQLAAYNARLAQIAASTAKAKGAR